MLTRTPLPANAKIAILCLLCLLLNACGGGSSESSSPVSVTSPVTETPPNSLAPISEPVTIPALPDMSITPPPGTVVDTTVPAPLPPVDAPSEPSKNPSSTEPVVSAPVIAELPPGAIPCQPSICPPFAANGSITNTYGASNPTEARAYLLPASEPMTGDAPYPDLRHIPTMIMPFVAVSVGEVPEEAVVKP